MPIQYLEDLVISRLSESWFLLKSKNLGKSYVYNNESCEFGLLPEDMPNHKLQQAINNIVQNKQIVPKSLSSPEKYLERRESPRLMLFLTASCNLKCVYCHCQSETGKLHMSDECAIDTVDRYIEFIDKLTGKIENIEITFMGGGEPFLRVKSIKKIVKHIEEKGIQGKYVIVTNGTLGSDSDWSWLASKNFRFTISADGPPTIQNNQRIFASGAEGTSKYVEKRLKHLSMLGVDVNIRSTVMEVSEESIDLICKYFLNFSCVKTHHLEPISFAGRGESCRDISEEAFYHLFFKNYSQHLYGNPTRFKSAWFKPFKKAQGFCGAVYYNAVVTHDGFVSLCSEVDSSALSKDYGEKYIVGHIREKNPFLPKKSFEFSQNHQTENMPDCSSCIIRYKCGGGCYIKRDRDFNTDAQFHSAFCANAIILNFSYLVGNINNVAY